MIPQTKAPLRASQRRNKQRLKLRRQAKLRGIILLAIILTAWLIDFTFFSGGTEKLLDDQFIDTKSINTDFIETKFIVTKSVAIGAILNWLAQSVFSWFVFRYFGAQAKHNIVGQLYVGQIVKWLIVIIGFSIIFMTLKSLSAASIILGFVIMQIGHFITLLQSR